MRTIGEGKMIIKQKKILNRVPFCLLQINNTLFTSIKKGAYFRSTVNQISTFEEFVLNLELISNNLWFASVIK